MKKERLPSANLILVLSLLSIITCWLLVGTFFAFIAIYLTKGEIKLYNNNPERYLNFHTLAVARVVTAIGLFINLFYLAFVLYIYTVIGFENLDSFNKNIQNKKDYLEQFE